MDYRDLPQEEQEKLFRALGEIFEPQKVSRKLSSEDKISQEVLERQLSYYAQKGDLKSFMGLLDAHPELAKKKEPPQEDHS